MNIVVSKSETIKQTNDLNVKQNNLSKDQPTVAARRALEFDEESTNSYVPPLPPKMDNLNPVIRSRKPQQAQDDPDYEPYDSGYSSNPSSEEVLNTHARPGESAVKRQMYAPYNLSDPDFIKWTESLQSPYYDVPPSQFSYYDRPKMRVAYRKDLTPTYDSPAPLSTPNGNAVYDRPISLVPIDSNLRPYYDAVTPKVAEKKKLAPSHSPSKDPDAPPLPPRKHRRTNSRELLDGYGYISDQSDDVFVVGDHTISRRPMFRNPPSLYFPDPPSYPPPPEVEFVTPARNHRHHHREPHQRLLTSSSHLHSQPHPHSPQYPRFVPNHHDIGFRNPGFQWDEEHTSAFKVISPANERHQSWRSDSSGSVYIPYQRESLV